MRKEVTRVCNLSSSRWRRWPRRTGINVVNQDFIFEEGEGGGGKEYVWYVSELQSTDYIPPETDVRPVCLN